MSLLPVCEMVVGAVDVVGAMGATRGATASSARPSSCCGAGCSIASSCGRRRIDFKIEIFISEWWNGLSIEKSIVAGVILPVNVGSTGCARYALDKHQIHK